MVSAAVFLLRQRYSTHCSSSHRGYDSKEVGSHQAKTDVGTLRSHQNPKEAFLLFSAGWG